MLVEHKQTTLGINVEGMRNAELAWTGSLDASDDLQEPSILGEFHDSEISIVCDKYVSISADDYIARAVERLSGGGVPGHTVLTESHD